MPSERSNTDVHQNFSDNDRHGNEYRLEARGCSHPPDRCSSTGPHGQGVDGGRPKNKTPSVHNGGDTGADRPKGRRNATCNMQTTQDRSSSKPYMTIRSLMLFFFFSFLFFSYEGSSLLVRAHNTHTHTHTHVHTHMANPNPNTHRSVRWEA